MVKDDEKATQANKILTNQNSAQMDSQVTKTKSLSFDLK